MVGRIKRARVSEEANPVAPALLTSLSLVCRVRREISGIAHVVQSISDFLDLTMGIWTLENVVESSVLEESSMIRLLDRLFLCE